METEGSLPSPLKLTTCPNPEPDQPSLGYQSYFFNINSLLPSYRRRRLTNGFFSLYFHTRTLYVPLNLPYVPRAPPIPSFLIWSVEKYLLKSTDHAVFIGHSCANFVRVRTNVRLVGINP